jgi:hypothetical protein
MRCGRYITVFYSVLLLSFHFRLSPTYIFPDLHISLQVYFLFLWRFDPIPGQVLPVRSFATTLSGHTTLGRIPLDEWPANHRHLYLTIKDTHKRHTSMCAAGFEPTIPTNERPQTHALDSAVTGSLFTPLYLYVQSLSLSSILYHCSSSAHHNSSALLL